MLPQLRENLVFQRGEPVLGGEYLVFQILQLLGDVTLAVCQGLLANVVVGNLIHEGFGDFNIIAENPVIAHLQGADTGLFLFGGFNGGDGAAAALQNVPEAVCRGVGSLPDDAALPDGQGRIVHNGIFNPVGAVGHGIHGLLQAAQQG